MPCCEASKEQAAYREPGGLQGEVSQWSAQLRSLRTELGVSQMFQPFDRLGQSIDGLRLTPRVRGILNWVVALKLKDQMSKDAISSNSQVSKKYIQDAMQTVFIDVSQNPCRRAYTPRCGVNHCLTTSTSLLHLGVSRVMVPAEYFLFQGRSATRTQFPENISNRTLQQLAGEGMFGASLGTVVWSLYLLGAFQDDVDSIPSSSDLEVIDLD